MPLDLVREVGGREGDDAARAHGNDPDPAALLVVDAQAVVEVDGHDGGPRAHDAPGQGEGQGRGPHATVTKEQTKAVPRQ